MVVLYHNENGEVGVFSCCFGVCDCDFPVNDGLNGTVTAERRWPEAEKWLLVALLGLEASVGVTANSLVLLVKLMVRHWSSLFLKILKICKLFSTYIT